MRNQHIKFTVVFKITPNIYNINIKYARIKNTVKLEDKPYPKMIFTIIIFMYHHYACINYSVAHCKKRSSFAPTLSLSIAAVHYRASAS